MASYDRRFLVPYLQDVCSAEMLCSRLEKEIAQCNNNVQWYANAVNQRITDPPYPSYSNYSDRDSSGGIIIFSVIIAIGLLALMIGWVIIGIGVMIYGGIGILAGFIEDSEENERRNKKYNEALEIYNKRIEQNKQLRAQIPQYQESLRAWEQHLDGLRNGLSKAQALRNSVYSVNIIPSKYRNVHVAYYLFDYFSTCRENDLDKIIQTLLLDQIVQKLDRIIDQNDEIILNQRYQIALEEQQNRMISENHRRELNKIAQLESNQQLQLDYQNMIARNQEVTNFFLAAEYIQKLKDQN